MVYLLGVNNEVTKCTRMSANERIKIDMKWLNLPEKARHGAILTHFIQNAGHYQGDLLSEEINQVIGQLNNGKCDAEHKDTSTVAESPISYGLFSTLPAIFPPVKKTTFTFIDLFAGIGGFRLALQQLGGKCIFSSEWDKQAQKTYYANFGEIPFGDITLESTKKYIPERFDILCAGFPCQSFSIAGKREGFNDVRGTLFFDVAEILRRKQPDAFLLENVKGLIGHDKGRTLSTILRVLREDLGYYVPEPEVLNAKDFGVPQNRERIFIVGFHERTGVSSFKYPSPVCNLTNNNFLSVREEKEVPSKYYLSTQYIDTLRNHKKRHEERGNGFGYEIIPDDGIANAIVVGGMGRERNLVIDNRLTDFVPTTNIKGEVNREGIRRMTPREWARLQGFPDDFSIPVSDTAAYKQFGNSVAIPAVKATAKNILKALNITAHNERE